MNDFFLPSVFPVPRCKIYFSEDVKSPMMSNDAFYIITGEPDLAARIAENYKYLILVPTD